MGNETGVGVLFSGAPTGLLGSAIGFVPFWLASLTAAPEAAPVPAPVAVLLNGPSLELATEHVLILVTALAQGYTLTLKFTV